MYGMKKPCDTNRQVKLQADLPMAGHRRREMAAKAHDNNFRGVGSP